jgi:hypothetical protein
VTTTTTVSGSRTNGKTTRHERGIALAIEHFDEIVRVAPWEWEVPNSAGTGFYLVNLKTETCNCPDRPPEDETDKHVVAAKYKKARTAICVGCGGRFRHRDLFDVGEDSLTFFEGDVVCRECACAHGIL